MVVYGSLLWLLCNEPGFMHSFGFNQASYFISFFLFTWLWSCSLDVPLRIGLRAYTMHQETEADLYTVERGYGRVYIDTLIKSHAKSLDLLFISRLDELLNVDHPNLRDRLKVVQDAVANQDYISSRVTELQQI